MPKSNAQKKDPRPSSFGQRKKGQVSRPLASIGDLRPDPRNARKHTPRNVGMIERAIGEIGAARSIVIDEDGVVLAGNATVEGAAAAGLTKLHVVDADGETVVAVRRTGLSNAQKAKLALYDNRAAELAEWDTDVLAGLTDELPSITEGLFGEDELADILSRGAESTPSDSDVTEADGRVECPNCGYAWSGRKGKAEVLPRASHARAVSATRNQAGCQWAKIGGCHGVVDVAHVNGDEMDNAPANLLKLCRCHHRLLDNGRIDPASPAMPTFYVDRSGKRRYRSNPEKARPAKAVA